MLDLAKTREALRGRRRRRIAAAAAALQPIPSLVELLRETNHAGLRYCHWKSNIRLDRSLRGLTDLDLLVHPNDIGAFRRLLRAHGLKPMFPPADQAYPGMEHHLGFDADSGRLFHLHVHSALVLGEEFVKNHRLPLLAAFLKSGRTVSGVRLPAPEIEIIVLAIRILLKTPPWKSVRAMFGGRHGGVGREFVEEVDFLWAQTDVRAIAQTLRQEVRFVSEDVILGFLTRLVEGRLTGLDVIRYRTRLARDLAPFRRQEAWRNWMRSAGSTLRRRLPGLRAGRPKQTLASGGLTIALVGADGAGKSTQVEIVRKWLAWKLEARSFYMGNKRPSPGTRLLNAVLESAKRIHRAARSAFGGEHFVTGLAARWARLWYGLYSLSTGYDRFSRFRQGEAWAARGAIVLYDRYPLKALVGGSSGIPMDGPQIERSTWHRPGGWSAVLADWEQKLYGRIQPVNRVLILHVDPAISMERKPHRNPAALAARTTTARQMGSATASVVEVDANRPLEEVALDIKRAVWGWM